MILVHSDVDDITSGRIRQRAIDAEGDPAGLVAQRNALQLFGRHNRGIKYMNAAIEGVIDP